MIIEYKTVSLVIDDIIIVATTFKLKQLFL